MPRLPFLLLIEEKEAKEDQGDDRLQVGRIGAEIFEGFHGVWLNRRRGLLGLSWGLAGWAQRVVWDFIGCCRMGAEDCFGLHGVRWVGVGGSLGLSRGLRPRTPTPFSSLDRRKGSKRRSRR